MSITFSVLHCYDLTNTIKIINSYTFSRKTFKELEEEKALKTRVFKRKPEGITERTNNLPLPIYTQDSFSATQTLFSKTVASGRMTTSGGPASNSPLHSEKSAGYRGISEKKRKKKKKIKHLEKGRKQQDII